MSSDPISRISASPAIPALPGAHSTSGRWGERRSAWIRACSRAPWPTTRTRGPGSDGANEVVDRDRDQRLVLRRAAGAELERDPGHGPLVRGLDHVDEIELAERGPLHLHGRAELL